MQPVLPSHWHNNQMQLPPMACLLTSRSWILATLKRFVASNAVATSTISLTNLSSVTQITRSATNAGLMCTFFNYLLCLMQLYGLYLRKVLVAEISMLRQHLQLCHQVCTSFLGRSRLLTLVTLLGWVSKTGRQQQVHTNASEGLQDAKRGHTHTSNPTWWPSSANCPQVQWQAFPHGCGRMVGKYWSGR